MRKPSLISLFLSVTSALSGFKDWGYQLGVSFDDQMTVTSETLDCLKKCAHVSTVFARVLTCKLPYFDKDGIALATVAGRKGMNVEYVVCVPCKDITLPDDFDKYREEYIAKTPVEVELRKKLFMGLFSAFPGRKWLDITAHREHGWFTDKAKNQQCFKDLKKECVFSSWHDHKDIMGTDFDISDQDIWYRNPLGYGDDSFNIPPMDDYRKFGQARTAVVKRYAEYASFCGVRVNFESYIPTAKAPPNFFNKSGWYTV